MSPCPQKSVDISNLIIYILGLVEVSYPGLLPRWYSTQDVGTEPLQMLQCGHASSRREDKAWGFGNRYRSTDMRSAACVPWPQVCKPRCRVST
jgi:hypothetical protein